MQRATLWLHVSSVNGHHQANKEHLKYRKVVNFLYFKKKFFIGLMMTVYGRNM